METMIRIDGWQWKQRNYGVDLSYSFWTTNDPSGTLWIVKFRGSFYSYREWVFSRLASRLGLNARNVQFAWVSEQDLIKTDQKNSEPFHLLFQHINVHGREPCNHACLYPEFKRHFNEDNDFCKFALNAHYNARDYILAGFLAEIFGANEMSEYLFGTDHKLHIIDSEEMFSTISSGQMSRRGFFNRDGSRSEAAHELLDNLCHEIVSLSDADLLHILKCPDEYKVDMSWEILPILRNGKRVACSILKDGPRIRKDLGC